MKYSTILLLLVLTFFSPKLTIAQNVESQLSTVNVDNLSDQQILSYWNKAKSLGYTIDQLGVLAKAKGMPAIQISKLKQRIATLRYATPNKNNKGISGTKNIPDTNS